MKVITELPTGNKPSDYLPVVEVDLKTLPSKGVPYPEGSKISFRVMDFGSVQKFNSDELSTSSKLKFMSEGIICSGFDKKDLAYYDFVYITMLRKISTFSSSKFTLRYQCQMCGEINECTGSLEEIEFSDLEADKLPLYIDTPDGDELEIGPVTLEKSLLLIDSKKDDDYVSNVAMQITNKQFNDAVNLVKGATGTFLEDIEECIRLTDFSRQYIDKICTASGCGESNHIYLSEVTELVQPFRTPRDTVRNRIRSSRK